MRIAANAVWALPMSAPQPRAPHTAPQAKTGDPEQLFQKLECIGKGFALEATTLFSPI